jgi:8-oxo-dGTP diphosphatase
MGSDGRGAVSGVPIPIGVAVVEHQGRFLVGIRPEGVPLAGYAEFPGGKCLPGESPETCAVRECFEESGLVVAATKLIDRVIYSYSHGDVELSFYLCAWNGESKPTSPFRWVDRAVLSTLRFPEANAPLIRILSDNGPR